MTANLLRLLVFIGAIFLLLESSLRFYYFGTDGFIPHKMNSYRVIIDSDLVQAADTTDVYYELKPNLNGLLSGHPVRTNSQGLPDKEYSLEKPDNTYRIAVVGSSWSMATGAATDQSYQALIEEWLNENRPEKNWEVINFSVEYYGLGEIIGNARHKALAYEPDLILMAITAVTPSFKWEDDKPPFTQIEITPPFWQSLVYSSLMARLGKQAYAKSERPTVYKPGGGYARNINRAMEEMAALTKPRDIEVAVLWLNQVEPNESMLKHTSQKAAEQDFDFVLLNLDELAGDRYQPREFLVGRVGQHPSELGHRLIADEIIATLWPDQDPVEQQMEVSQ